MGSKNYSFQNLRLGTPSKGQGADTKPILKLAKTILHVTYRTEYENKSK